MQPNERLVFDQALERLAVEFRVSIPPAYVKDNYWDALKCFSAVQFVDICSKLSATYKKKWGDDFPLPADFSAAITPDYQREFKPEDSPHRGGFTHVNEIISRLIALMPPPGKFNTDEEAEAMMAKMDAIVAAEYADDPPTYYLCDICDDSGYVHCWFQFRKGFYYEGSEVQVERVPNSPYWITKHGAESPNVELRLTPCIARCTCRAGQNNPRGIPFSNSFQKLAGGQFVESENLSFQV
jgi:hypothetical protein